jgi:hypothetical protein
MSEEYFARLIPWKPADDKPVEIYPSLIVMSELPQVKSSILGDDDEYDDTTPHLPGELGLIIRYPHLKFDSLGAFPDLKAMSHAEIMEQVVIRSNDYLERWKIKDNIEEAMVNAPKGKKEDQAFTAIGINQLFAAGLMYLGTANGLEESCLWVYRFNEAIWKPTCYTFPPHNGTGIENGGYHLFVLSNSRLRCIDCVLGAQPLQRWRSNKIPFENPKLAVDYRSTIVAAFGRVIMETVDNSIMIFDLNDGTLIQTIKSDITVISLACSHQTFVAASDLGEVAAYGRVKDSKEFRKLSQMKYSGDLKTKSKKEINVPVGPICQLIHQSTKICFAMGQAVIMEERHPSMQRMRILRSLPTRALGLIADHVVAMGIDGTLRIAYFAETKAFFAKTYDIGAGIWRHNHSYISGTFAVLNIIFPDGRLLFLRPKPLPIAQTPMDDLSETPEAELYPPVECVMGPMTDSRFCAEQPPPQDDVPVIQDHGPVAGAGYHPGTGFHSVPETPSE